ncbi:hypothetical protein E2K80_06875 [Rhodophyticola sp. CCM32]|uniref:hypothetical protein n=1 Tax=Rhodophyticola sp. CCM32 TaxID=2916397 RepID=UPI00107F6730|nr:hypothetical protein [Rhodophyticola sp. CCM32]QBY00493.1 hypothetical protein E2K80_06875 [Rhodophyticola sp. CCM32]
MTTDPPLLLDSITDLRPDHAGKIAISGSHGGLYPAAVASRGGLRAVVFNDAGIGFQRAGVSGVMQLDTVGMAAAAVDCMSAEIGSAQGMQDAGRISTVNARAAACGLAVGMEVAEAIPYLMAAPTPDQHLPELAEARRSLTLPQGRELSLLDSASLVGPEDEGGIVITGSHGGLIGGDPARALKARAHIAVFNDAGGGKNRIGISRLPALETRGIAAVTVSHMTARIGDAFSSLETGRISTANPRAMRLGAFANLPLKDWLRQL